MFTAANDRKCTVCYAYRYKYTSYNFIYHVIFMYIIYCSSTWDLSNIYKPND